MRLKFGSLSLSDHLNMPKPIPHCSNFIKIIFLKIHKEVRKADQAVQRCGGMVRCGWDDGYFLGPKEEVFQALNLLSSEVQRSSGMVLQVTKSEQWKKFSNLDFFIMGFQLLQMHMS